MKEQTRLIFCLLAILGWLSVIINKADARGRHTESHPDSVYVITYANGSPAEGIKMAYSVDRKTWTAIGTNHSFVKSDYGSWGANKKMYSPSVLLDNGMWYAVWTVHNKVNQFATTRSTDFWVWKPQDYPYLGSGETCLSPHLTKHDGKYVVIFKTSDGSTRLVSSTDFKSWSHSTLVSDGLYDATDRSETATVNGEKVSGEVHRVPYSLVETLTFKVNDAARRNSLYNENCGEDGQRFRGVKAVNATLNITGESKAISDKLIGIFFEDINYSADGGLYAELIQNRDFEYTPDDHGDWNAQSFWELTGTGSTWTVCTDNPIHANNSHYAEVGS